MESATRGGQTGKVPRPGELEQRTARYSRHAKTESACLSLGTENDNRVP